MYLKEHCSANPSYPLYLHRRIIGVLVLAGVVNFLHSSWHRAVFAFVVLITQMFLLLLSSASVESRSFLLHTSAQKGTEGAGRAVRRYS